MKILRKLWVSTKCPRQEIKWNDGIICSVGKGAANKYSPECINKRLWQRRRHDSRKHLKCPYSYLFWSGFSCIGTEYGEIRSTSPYSVRTRENKDQNDSECGHFSRSIYTVYTLFTQYTHTYMYNLFKVGKNYKNSNLYLQNI